MIGTAQTKLISNHINVKVAIAELSPQWGNSSNFLESILILWEAIPFMDKTPIGFQKVLPLLTSIVFLLLVLEDAKSNISDLEAVAQSLQKENKRKSRG